jgi:hypothetical protein
MDLQTKNELSTLIERQKMKPKKLSRSEKKRAKNIRIAECEGQDKENKKINAFARKMADLFALEEHPEKHLFGRLCLCRTCGNPYCLCYDGTTQFCVDCHYRRGCLKINYPEDCDIPQEPILHRECKQCYWERVNV